MSAEIWGWKAVKRASQYVGELQEAMSNQTKWESRKVWRELDEWGEGIEEGMAKTERKHGHHELFDAARLIMKYARATVTSHLSTSRCLR